MNTNHKPATALRPQDVAQMIKIGRGWAVTRNSATLAVTDYEHMGREIVDALNKRHAYPKLVDALRVAVARLVYHEAHDSANDAIDVLRELEESA